MGNAANNRQKAEEKSQAGNHRFSEYNLYEISMKKEDADLLKAEFNEGTPSAVVLEYMEEDDVRSDEEVLDFLERHLQAVISDYSLDESCTLLDEDKSCLVRSYWFSRGMVDTFLCITPDGKIVGMDPEVPMSLLSQVAGELGKLLEE